MGYNTADTEWPEVPIPQDVRVLIDLLFSTLDDSSKNAGPKLADEIFAHDGMLTAAAGTACGYTEIKTCREHAWSVVRARRHTVQRVYTHDARGLDLLLIGHVQMTLSNQKTLSGEFTARILLSRGDENEPRVKKYQVWADSAPMTKALQEIDKSKGS